MPTEIQRPDVDAVLSTLKDFQRDTVDYVFRRLYLDEDRTHRFLVADEVGLGKTLVARGVVARTIDHLWDSVGRIDVVYICSSGDIARQNVSRLNITNRADWALASRVTLLPTQLRDIQNRKVNFIAFTPGTTFKLASSAGQANERVLLYWLLHSAWSLHGAGAQNLLQGWVQDHERFRDQIRYFDRESIDKLLERKFHEALDARAEKDRASGAPGLRERFQSLCEAFGRARIHIPHEERIEQNRIIGDLRSLLASTCIRALEPDLVILDEFQRFKDLLSAADENESEEAKLARELFDYSEGAEKTRILLLSATPYKMYTTADEVGVEDHYADFLQTLRFLNDDKARTQKAVEALQSYRRALRRLEDSGGELKTARDLLESELRRVMVRTERLGASEDRNGMLREVNDSVPQLRSEDALIYRRLQKLADEIEHPDTVEYWKSAPYLLSFMDDYLLKTDVEEALEDPEGSEDVLREVSAARDLFLPDSVVQGKAALQPPHARMRWLLDLVLADDRWRALWLPPTMPYYQPAGVFAQEKAIPRTKQLIFSSWQVVPKAVAGLLSYEAERRMLKSFSPNGESTNEVRERLVPLLRFNRSDGRLSGMPVLGLIYPSIFLAGVGDPLAFATYAAGVLPAQQELLHRIERSISAAITPLLQRYTANAGAPDESWYWAAPILLDLQQSPEATRGWLSRRDASRRWSGEEADDDSEFGEPIDRTAWADHVARARALIDGGLELGSPPADLIPVLARLALAGPAVAALRALGRISGGSDSWRDFDARDAAGRIAWSFRNLFNLPEVIASLRSMRDEEPYWLRVLEYACDGNLQALLDEYAHVLRDSLGLFGKESREVYESIADAAATALGLRTAQVKVDRLRPARGEAPPKLKKHSMRARFAARFGDEVDIDGKRANRKDAVRSAFNSPFWPFVLATTSVGQEGLDFHLYCHSVVHWNLPSNPVDLEQREGRVHRFKGHAVRKNVAKKFGAFRGEGEDPWETVFERARAERAPGLTDIVPYWVYQVEGGAAIERRVPTLPLSRDQVRLKELRRALAVYRMVFGQPRQDELLEFLLTQMPVEDVAARLDELKIDLSVQTRAAAVV